MSYSLQPHGLQHARLPCPSPSPGDVAQTHVHWVGNTIQPSHPLSSPSPPAFSLSQHQGLFQWLWCLHQVAKILELQLQYQSFQWIFRVDFRVDWLDLLAVQGTLKSLPAPQFKSINSSVLSLLYVPSSYIWISKTGWMVLVTSGLNCTDVL